MKVAIYSAYSDKPVDLGIDCSVEPSMTKQSFAAECDINNIMARFERTGVLDFTNEFEPRYGDATALDYQTSLNIVINAQTMFDAMPAALRLRFGNDPQEFLAFVDDPRNVEESIKLGLRVVPVVSPDPTPIPVVLVPSAPLPASPVPSAAPS